MSPYPGSTSLASGLWWKRQQWWSCWRAGLGSGAAMMALHGGEAGSDNGELGVSLREGRARGRKCEWVSGVISRGASPLCTLRPDQLSHRRCMDATRWPWPMASHPLTLTWTRPSEQMIELTTQLCNRLAPNLWQFSENHNNQSCRATYDLQFCLNEFSLDQPSL